MLPPDSIYPIGVARKLTALSERQIRYYEQLGLISPARSSGNRRLFSQRDIELLLTIREKINQGWALEGIRQAIRDGDLMPISPKPASSVQIRREGAPHVQGLTSIFPVRNHAELERHLSMLERKFQK